MDLAILGNILTTDAGIMCVLGTMLGIIIGAIPGLGAPIGIAVMLPFTYGMSPITGLVLLASIYMGCAFGGSISGILLNIPGTSESIPTTLEGYPMAQKGRGKEALYLAAISSAIGGVFGCLVLMFCAPSLARVALKFGPAEMGLVSIIGLAVIASLTGDNMWKGILGACFGMLFASVGLDPVGGRSRFTFGSASLVMGFKQVALALGLIAGRQMVVEILKAYKRAKLSTTVDSDNQVVLEKISPLTVLKNIFRKDTFTVIKSAIMGTFIGILPGAGVAIAAYVAYGDAKRNFKEPAGSGVPKGIIAAEAANNAGVGGAFVPMLALGIPGSNACALIFGALTIHGIVVGPTMFTNHGDLSYGFMFGLMLSAIVMAVISILFTPIFSRIVKLKMKYIIPPIVCCVLLGAFAIRNNMFDVFVALAFTAIGYLFHIVKIPPAPVFLGFILEPLLEKNLLTAATIASARKMSMLQYIFNSRVCIIITIVGIIVFYLNFRSVSKQKKTKKEMEV